MRAQTAEGFAHAFVANQARAQETGRTRNGRVRQSPSWGSDEPDRHRLGSRHAGGAGTETAGGESRKPPNRANSPRSSRSAWATSKRPRTSRAFIQAGQDVGVTALGMTVIRCASNSCNNAAGRRARVHRFRRVRQDHDRGRQGRPGPQLHRRRCRPTASFATDIVHAPAATPRLVRWWRPSTVAPAFVDPQDRNTLRLAQVTRRRCRDRSCDGTQRHPGSHADQIAAALEDMHVIVPVQVGPTMAERAVEVMEQFPDALIRAARNQGAISDEQPIGMLDALEGGGSGPLRVPFPRHRRNERPLHVAREAGERASALRQHCQPPSSPRMRRGAGGVFRDGACGHRRSLATLADAQARAAMDRRGCLN